jgi:hypothetical protein
MIDISKVRQSLFKLNKERWELLEQIMQPGKLLKAQFYERRTKCGSTGCKCASGELHGPFPWIYRNRKGEKLVSTSCNADRVEEAKQCSGNYKKFLKMSKEIQKINEEITSLISKIEDYHEIAVETFTKKVGETRGRKSGKN